MSLGIDKALRSWRSGEVKCSALLLHADSDRAICAGMYQPAVHLFLPPGSCLSRVLIRSWPSLWTDCTGMHHHSTLLSVPGQEHLLCLQLHVHSYPFTSYKVGHMSRKCQSCYSAFTLELSATECMRFIQCTSHLFYSLSTTMWPPSRSSQNT